LTNTGACGGGGALADGERSMSRGVSRGDSTPALQGARKRESATPPHGCATKCHVSTACSGRGEAVSCVSAVACTSGVLASRVALLSSLSACRERSL
jgi:hypothetical protein